MIGLDLDPAHREAAREFFELFKTPCEDASSSGKYRIVLSTTGNIEQLQADLYVIYGSAEYRIDIESGHFDQSLERVDVRWKGSTLPIYGRVATFNSAPALLHSDGKCMAHSYSRGSAVVHRVGYDLFGEVDYLLRNGQPSSTAGIPTLELHIAILRQLLSDAGVTFVEIPPRPHDYRFICCLTHDVDFFGIRRHKFDGTLAGFLARASLGTAVNVARGKRSLNEALRNWSAVLSLPLVFLRLRSDFWNPFTDYARVEKGRRSTFFLVPFKGRPGVPLNGNIARRRAVKYQVSEIQSEARQAAAEGSELAVHGIDAWSNERAGRSEMRELLSITGGSRAGVRMHWLYFATDSPRHLEAAGFEYDSTYGYNDAVGYKAGTSQVFRLPQTSDLMELPMSIMDSALFYSSRMGLSQRTATDLCRQIIANACEYGGTVVVNWHDRSLAPERQWSAFYQELLEEVGREDQAWFATAQEAVNWFRWRRGLRFSTDGQSRNVTVTSTWPLPHGPAGSVRVQRPGEAGDARVEIQRLACDDSMTVHL
jgi:hypothetical protein